MVVEKMQQSLRGLVERYENIPLNVKLSILDEVCLGLRYLHSRNPPIVRRDLTPNNILLSRYLEAKITDLGVAKLLQTTDTKTMTKAPPLVIDRGSNIRSTWMIKSPSLAPFYQS